MSKKETLRTSLKHLRTALSLKRREEAALSLFTHLLPKLDPFPYILSFSSFGSEIDTALLNLYLARTGRLLLPKVEGGSLTIFHIHDLEKQLSLGAFGILEPNPKYAQQADPSQIDLALVPALAFDPLNHRLGYGLGCYDRFLQTLPSLPTVGIGFKEQLIPSLPSETTDIPLQKVSLF